MGGLCWRSGAAIDSTSSQRSEEVTERSKNRLAIAPIPISICAGPHNGHVPTEEDAQAEAFVKPKSMSRIDSRYEHQQFYPGSWRYARALQLLNGSTHPRPSRVAAHREHSRQRRPDTTDQIRTIAEAFAQAQERLNPQTTPRRLPRSPFPIRTHRRHSNSMLWSAGTARNTPSARKLPSSSTGKFSGCLNAANWSSTNRN